ncbi:MAG TPA: efflux RND transporter periplasmic adaptor subunit [Longimicrobiaceae bacterium]|nr:efflux RND transporter periplasmic adaptor subunit [Longimicrobiaceae bacterium]
MIGTRAKALALGALVTAAGALAGCGGSAEAVADTAPETAAVERRDLDVAVEAAGVVEPIRVVEVKSKASGEILALHVETGDRVARGSMLAEIDPRDVSNALAQAEADLSVAQVTVSTAGAERRRMQELREAQVATQQEYEAAVQQAASAQAQLVRARTNLELARQRSGDVTIRAPIAGTVIERGAETGQIIASATSNVSGGTTLLKMADLSEVQVRAKVDETDLGQVQPGQAARVTVESYPGRTFTGTVLKVEPQAVVEQNVTLFPVLVRLENRDGLLRPGMNADVQIQVVRRPGATVVPNGAVVGVRDAGTAAEALGLDPEAVQASLRPPGAPDASPECRALMQKVRDAGGPAGLAGEDRAKMRECRSRPGGGRAGGQGSADGTRPGVVFVEGATGPEARRVTLGVSDWEHTEVLGGLEAGERVRLMSAARLKQEQQQVSDRMRQRAGGGIMPGGGGPTGGGSRRGG